MSRSNPPSQTHYESDSDEAGRDHDEELQHAAARHPGTVSQGSILNAHHSTYFSSRRNRNGDQYSTTRDYLRTGGSLHPPYTEATSPYGSSRAGGSTQGAQSETATISQRSPPRATWNRNPGPAEVEYGVVDPNWRPFVSRTMEEFRREPDIPAHLLDPALFAPLPAAPQPSQAQPQVAAPVQAPAVSAAHQGNSGLMRRAGLYTAQQHRDSYGENNSPINTEDEDSSAPVTQPNTGEPQGGELSASTHQAGQNTGRKDVHGLSMDWWDARKPGRGD